MHLSFVFFLFITLVNAGCATSHSAYHDVDFHNPNLKKEIFYEADFESFVSFIGLADYDADSQEELLVLSGRKGVLLAFPDKHVKRNLSFIAGFRPVAIPFHKAFLILASGGGYSDIGLLDNNGKELWKPPLSGRIPANQMLGGDINDDGVLEFFVADRRGVHCYDIRGKKLWTYGRNEYTALGLVYAKEHQAGSIIAKNANKYSNGAFDIIDFHGQMTRRIDTPDKGIISFQICRWPVEDNILAYSGSRIYLIDMHGTVLLDYDLEETIFAITGSGLQLISGESPCLAILAKGRSSTRQSTLLIFSSQGLLLHKETLDVSLGMTTVPAEDHQTEQLLVGDGRNTVWLYKLRSASGGIGSVRASGSEKSRELGSPIRGKVNTKISPRVVF